MMKSAPCPVTPPSIDTERTPPPAVVTKSTSLERLFTSFVFPNSSLYHSLRKISRTV